MDHGQLIATLWSVRIKGNKYIQFRTSDNDDDLWLQIIHTEIGAEANGRKWRISAHATRSEIVQTAFKAYLTWLEHEAREEFMYRNQAIFGPHFDVDTLADMLEAKTLGHDVRSARLVEGDHVRLKDSVFVNDIWQPYRDHLVGTIIEMFPDADRGDGILLRIDCPVPGLADEVNLDINDMELA